MLALAFLRLDLVVGIAYLQGADGSCPRNDWFVWSGINCDGAISHLTAEPVDVTSCGRICRLYKECVGFNMNWTDPNQQFGFCSVMSENIGWQHPITFNDNLSFYEKDYKGKNIVEEGSVTACTAAVSEEDCVKAIDGSTDTIWVGSSWIELRLNGSYEIHRLDLDRSWAGARCSAMEFIFDEVAFNVTRHCESSAIKEVYYLNVTKTSTIRVSCREYCITGLEELAFAEIGLWGINVEL